MTQLARDKGKIARRQIGQVCDLRGRRQIEEPLEGLDDLGATQRLQFKLEYEAAKRCRIQPPGMIGRGQSLLSR